MTMDAQSLISDDDVERFRRDGVVVLRQVFTDWIDGLTQGIEQVLKDPSGMEGTYTEEGSPGLFFGDFCNWQRIPQFKDFITGSPGGAMAARLMGSERAQFFHEHVLVKEPGTEVATPWHQDLPYYCVDGDDTVSFWTPMDPVPENVSLKFAAGSHRWGKLFTPCRFEDGGYMDYNGPGCEPLPDIEGNPDDYDILSWALEPGDTLAFYYHTLHSAPPNPGPARRRAFVQRWLGDDVRFIERPGQTFPPYTQIGIDLKPGERMREDWFPVIWPAGEDEADAAK